MKYIYFVSYSFVGYMMQGVGRCEIIRGAPIETIDDIEWIEKAIATTGSAKAVRDFRATVMGYNLLRTEQGEAQ